MICVFQLLRAVDGVRSQAVEGSREQFAQNLLPDGKLLESVSPDDFVLALLDAVDDKWAYSYAPLLSVRSFVSQFHPSHLEL